MSHGSFKLKFLAQDCGFGAFVIQSWQKFSLTSILHIGEIRKGRMTPISHYTQASKEMCLLLVILSRPQDNFHTRQIKQDRNKTKTKAQKQN